MSQKTLNCNSYTILKSFTKSDPTIVAFAKTGTGTANTTSNIFVEIDNKTIYIPSNTSITMPTLTEGTDYTIWITPSGTIQATNNSIIPPVTNAKKVGGFHYAPGGNATANTGGDTTPQINEYSFWDLKFRPICSNPQGMTLVADTFWCDIYLTGNTAVTSNCSSVYNVTITDANNSPIIPTQYGGNGSTTYGGYTWYEAMELANAFEKRPLTNQEFIISTYGVTEELSANTDPIITKLDAARTSKWGLIQATGNMFIYGAERGGANTGPAWHSVTESRGSEYNEPYASRFGGAYNSANTSGSRCSRWDTECQTDKESGIAVNSSRFACDHLWIE